MMGGSSLLISVLPTYSTIGMLTPILMTVLRMLQGLSVGGEYGAATTFLAESAPAGRRGFYGSFLFVSIAAGLLAASALVWALEAWGWRIPFFIGGCGAIIGFWMRRNVAMTHLISREEYREHRYLHDRAAVLWRAV